MAFKAGAIYGEALLDTKKWEGGLSRMTKGVGVAAAAIAAAFTAAMAASVKAANEFQIAMANVSTIVDTSTTDMQGLALQILQLNPALGDATELTNGLYQAFSAGAKDAEDAMNITASAAKFGRAALTDTFTAVDVLTTAVNAYGSEVVSTEKASDIFFTTIKQGKITGDQLASTIGASIPLFASAGIPLEQLASGMAAMTKQGVSAAESTTQLNAIVTAFLKPSEEMNVALAEMGYQSGAAFLEAEGLTGALELLETATDGDAGAMAGLLPNVRALRGAMALTGVGGDTFTATLNEMENSLGATDEAFQKQELTFETFKNSAKNLQVIVGNIGKHFVDQIAGGATTAANSMIQFLVSSEGARIVSDIIGGLAGAFELVKGVVEPLIITLRDVFEGIFVSLGEAIAQVSGETTGGAGAMKLLSVVVNLTTSALTVMGKIVEGIIQLIADLVIGIRESTETIGSFFRFLSGKGSWEEVKANASGAGEAFKDLGQNFVESVGEIYETVRNEVKEFSGETEQLTSDLTAKVTTAFENTRDGVRANWGEMITGQAELVDALGQAGLVLSSQVAETNDAIEQDTIATVFNLEATWQDYFDGVHSGFSSTFAGITDTVALAQQNATAEIDRNLQLQLEQLDSNLADGVITQEFYDAKKKELETAATEERNAVAEKQFETNKKFQIGQVWIDAAGAVVGWWRAATRLGPFAGPIFGAVMTGATLALAAKQTALISEQQFVPAKQAGGMAGGATRINERGGEIVTLPDGSQVIPNDISQQIAGNTGGITNYISFDGAQITDNMSLERVTDHVIRKLGRQMRVSA